MKESLHRETDDLEFAWSSKTPEKLRNYLVSGIQDPRSNLQSILTRHFFIRQLFGSQFEQLPRTGAPACDEAQLRSRE